MQLVVHAKGLEPIVGSCLAMQRGKGYSRGFNIVFYGIKNLLLLKRKPKMRVVKSPVGSNYGNIKKTVSVEPKMEVQQQIDAILDKISKSGYEALSKKEKDYLFRHGKDI